MEASKLKVIITGSTGMVGEGVLHMCLQSPDVDEVLIINRRSLGLTHPKLKEIIHPDFFDLSSIKEKLSGYNACFFCLGISSVGVKPDDYYKTTYTLTMSFAETLCVLNPDMTFCYVSGMGTDGTEKGKVRWARVKGKTENDLMRLPFKRVYAFRPGFIMPIAGLTKAHKFYKYINWIFPIGKKLQPDGFNTLEEVGNAMISAALTDNPVKILAGKEISRLAAMQTKK